MDRHKRTLIDVWEKLTNGERAYLLKLAKQHTGQHITMGLLPLVAIDKFLPAISRRFEFLVVHDDHRRFLRKLHRKLT